VQAWGAPVKKGNGSQLIVSVQPVNEYVKDSYKFPDGLETIRMNVFCCDWRPLTI